MGIECLRVQFPKGVDANDYARTTKPADKALGMLLSRAVWLGKGKRPTVAVSEAPTPSEQDENPKPAVKEKSTLDAESVPDPGEVAAADPEQPVFSFPAPLPLLSPLPFAAGPVIELPLEIRGEEIWITQGPRRYRVLFLDKKPASGKLSVNVLVEGQTPRGATSFHVDALDLYTARLRTVYAKQAAAELDAKEETIERELRLLLRRLEVLQQERLKCQSKKNRQLWKCCAVRICWNASWATSSAAGLRARTPTSSLDIWRRCRGCWNRRWR
jgi:hypothetical protein